MTVRAVRPCLEAWAFERLRWLGGESLVESVVDGFLAQAPRRLAAARAALDAGDLGGVMRACQALEASAAQLGAVRLAQACADAGRTDRTGVTAAATLVNRVAEEAEAVVAALRRGDCG